MGGRWKNGGFQHTLEEKRTPLDTRAITGVQGEGLSKNIPESYRRTLARWD